MVFAPQKIFLYTGKHEEARVISSSGLPEKKCRKLILFSN